MTCCCLTLNSNLSDSQHVKHETFFTLGFYVTVRYHLSLSRSRDELGVLCQTSRLVDGGASLEAVSAVGAHKQTGGGGLAVLSVKAWSKIAQLPKQNSARLC